MKAINKSEKAEINNSKLIYSRKKLKLEHSDSRPKYKHRVE